MKKLASLLTINEIVPTSAKTTMHFKFLFQMSAKNTWPGTLYNWGYFHIILNWKFNSKWGKLRSELALFESAATRYICQMRSAPAANRTRHVGSVPLGHVADTSHCSKHLTNFESKIYDGQGLILTANF